MPTCLFCLKDRSELTDEHIIPAALGGNLLLRGATCTECQRVCNKGFETRFLKGSNFISLIRSNLGIRGRGNEPIYGFDQHGAPLTVLAQSGFPPIRVGLAYQKLERPMQVILLNELRSPLEYCFLPEKIALPVGASFFSSVIETVPDGCASAALWADGDILPVNHWRQLMEAFLSWCQASNIAALVSTAATGSAKIDLSVDWNSDYRNRGLTKIALMYALYRMETAQRTASELLNVREYVLNGTSYPPDYWKDSPLYQWNGPDVGAEVLGDRQFSYFLATVNVDRELYGLVQLHNMGLFVAKLTAPTNAALCPNTASLYILQREDNGKYSLREDALATDLADSLAEAIAKSGQL